MEFDRNSTDQCPTSNSVNNKNPCNQGDATSTGSLQQLQDKINTLQAKVEVLVEIVEQQDFQLRRMAEALAKLCKENMVHTHPIDCSKSKNGDTGFDFQHTTRHGDSPSELTSNSPCRQPRPRTTSDARSVDQVILLTSLLVVKNSILILERNFESRAVECSSLDKFKAAMRNELEKVWNDDDNGDAKLDLGLNLKKGKEAAAAVVIKLDEDGHVADLTKAPTRLDGDVVFPEQTYQAWYERNVLKGRQERYQVEFKWVV